MAFTTTITLTSDVDQSVVSLWNQNIIYGATPELVADQAANVRSEINAKIIYFPKFANLALPSALTEDTDPASVALVDSANSATPVEEGNVVTTGRLAELQSGGRANIAAAFLIGRNAGATLDNRAITALEAFTTTLIYPNAVTAVGNLSTTDNLDKVFANRLYNKLARTNVAGLFGGNYIGIAHDDCLHDLRQDTANGSWTDVNKYADPSTILRNEVGMFAGIRWLRSSNVTVTADSNQTIDSYKVNVLGFNSLGKGESQPLQLRVTGPFDKLGRFVNFGWYWVGKYVVVDTAAMVQGIVASSIGAN